MSEDVRRHLIVTGPGRSGTTLLVRLLSELGLDTGLDRLAYYPRARAGLEVTDIFGADVPYVVKDPRLSYLLGRYLKEGRIRPERIDHVIIPIRDRYDAAASRAKISLEAGHHGAPGGYWLAKGLRGQRAVLAEMVYELVLTLAEYEIPHVYLAYPRFAQDPAYAFRRLGPALASISEARFRSAWESVVDGQLVHDRRLLRTTLLGRLAFRAVARRRAVRGRL